MFSINSCTFAAELNDRVMKKVILLMLCSSLVMAVAIHILAVEPTQEVPSAPFSVPPSVDCRVDLEALIWEPSSAWLAVLL